MAARLASIAARIGDRCIAGAERRTTTSREGLLAGAAGTAWTTVAKSTLDGDGNFGFDFVPTSEFQGESLGTWTAQVCVSGTDGCVQGTFDIGQ